MHSDLYGMSAADYLPTPEPANQHLKKINLLNTAGVVNNKVVQHAEAAADKGVQTPYES